MHWGYVNSAEVFNISRYLLLRFVSSDPVFKAYGENTVLIQHILQFFRGRVFVHENYICTTSESKFNIILFHMDWHMR